jgi:hypothetical protein
MQVNTAQQEEERKAAQPAIKWNNKKLLILAGILGLFWAYTGFANPTNFSPDNLYYYFVGGKKECIRFATERSSDIGWKNKTITAGDIWFKKGRVVVELIATGGGYKSDTGEFDSSKNLESRLCVLGGGMVSIPSMLENPVWR